MRPRTEGPPGPGETRLARGLPRAVESLANPSYLVYWVGMLAMFFGFHMEFLVRSWYIYELTNRAFLVGVAGAAHGLAVLLLSFPGGALADRLDKRLLLVAGQFLIIFPVIAVGLAIRFGIITWWHLLLLALFKGVASGLLVPARHAIVAELVEARLLTNAISLNAIGQNISRMAGPALGGLLLALLQTEKVFYAMGALYLLASILTLAIPRSRVLSRRQRRSVFRDMGEGLRYIRDHSVILGLLLLGSSIVVFGVPIQQLLPVYTENALKVGPRELGWLMGGVGLGALLGAGVVAFLGEFRRKGLLMLALTVLLGLSIMALALSRNLFLSLAVAIPVGIGLSSRQTLNNILLQANTEHAMRGKVMGLFSGTFGLQSLGLLSLSAAADFMGITAALTIGGVAVVLSGLGMGLLYPQIRRLE